MLSSSEGSRPVNSERDVNQRFGDLLAGDFWVRRQPRGRFGRPIALSRNRERPRDRAEAGVFRPRPGGRFLPLKCPLPRITISNVGLSAQTRPPSTRSTTPSARAGLRSLTIRSGITTQVNQCCLARAQDSCWPASRRSVWHHYRSEPLEATHPAGAAACFLQSPQFRELPKIGNPRIC